MSEPKISIIVPVYNAEKYLHQCVDSILAQTYTDFELLLIDDGSKDGSGAICDEYAAKDDRIRVFHKENGGVSSARNIGLDNARGEWICFVDSDDWVENDFLSSFMGQDKLCDLTNFSCRDQYEDHTKEYHLVDEAVVDAIHIEELMHKTMRTEGLDFLSVPWGKFYRRAIIERQGLRFNPEICFREDEIFVTNYCLYVKSFETRSKITYNFRKSEGSLSSKRRDFKGNYTLGASILERAQKFQSEDMLRFMTERAWTYLIGAMGQARSLQERKMAYELCTMNYKEFVSGKFRISPALKKAISIKQPFFRKLAVIGFLCMKQLRNSKYNTIDV